MIVICEECGKKYRVDPTKIKGTKARFTCKDCGHLVSVKKPKEDAAGQDTPAPDQQDEAQSAPTASSESDEGTKLRGIGLRSKMFLLFLLVPLVLIAGAGGLYLWQLDALSNMFVDESSKIVADMSEKIIEENARAVALQTETYLRDHPELSASLFDSDQNFKAIAVQKVGKTGYTALYQVPGDDGIWRTWAHVNSKIVGIDMSGLKKALGENFDDFWKIYTAVANGKESRGYYTWRDSDGRLREKFMVCTPVKDTPYVIASTTYMDEITLPLKRLEAQARLDAGNIRNFTIAILLATIILIGLIVSIYGYRLTQRIKSLTSVADRISVGELDAQIDTSAGDEIGALGEAIARMQDSVRLSIERLRRRR
jgi:HAMP domain-containing protein